jgi:hypothetical protein
MERENSGAVSKRHEACGRKTRRRVSEIEDDQIILKKCREDFFRDFIWDGICESNQD